MEECLLFCTSGNKAVNLNLKAPSKEQAGVTGQLVLVAFENFVEQKLCIILDLWVTLIKHILVHFNLTFQISVLYYHLKYVPKLMKG